jgi:predicted amidohydrolase
VNDTLFTLKVASIQYRAIPSNKEENIRCLSDLVSEAAVNNAKIIVLPEMCTTGLNIQNRSESEIHAETIPGPATNVFAMIAGRYKVHIVLGMAEFDPTTGKFYNSQVILGPDGSVIGKYRKIHLFGPDLNWAEIGDLGYQAVNTDWGRIGLGICCDINYWEFINFLSEAQVDIVTFSTNWVGDGLPFQYWSEMVAGCNCYLIAANNWGEESGLHFSGGSTILAPDSTVLSCDYFSTNTIIYAEFTPKLSEGSAHGMRQYAQNVSRQLLIPKCAP